MRTFLLATFLLLAMTLTGCNRQAEHEEQVFSGTADENIEVPNDSVITDTSYDEASNEYSGETITQFMEGSDGRKITIDAQVYSDGIDQVSCYRYVPEPFTEEMRNALLKEMHPAETWNVVEATVYNSEKDAWEFMTPTGKSWSYQITHSDIPGEDILCHRETTADISPDIKQVFPILIVGEGDIIDEYTLSTLSKVADTIPAEIIQFGLYNIGAIDYNDSYSCDLIHVCETMDGQFCIRAVFRKTIDGIPVTAWHNFGTITGKGSPFPIKIWGSLFSEAEIGIDQPVLSAGEAVAAIQQQINQIPIQEEPLTITKISLEYLSVSSPDKELLIVPVWRFWAGEDEKARSLRSEEIIAVNALNGELIWEKREAFAE